MPSISAPADRYARLVSPHRGRKICSRDRFQDYRTSHSSSFTGFQEDELYLARRIRRQEIEALQSREMGRHLGHGLHPHYFEAERQGSLPLPVSPFTESIEPNFFPLRSARAVIPNYCSTLPNELDRSAWLYMDLLERRASVDGGFDRVRQILKALEVAKQHIQTCKEPTELPETAHLKEEPRDGVDMGGRETSLVREGNDRYEFLLQNQSPSSQLLEKECLQQSYLSSQLRMPKHAYQPSQTRPDERAAF